MNYRDRLSGPVKCHTCLKGEARILWLTTHKRLLLWIGGELLGIALLVVFVVVLASMPPLQLTPQPTSTIGYSVKVDTDKWSKNIAGYWKTIKTGSLGIDYKKRDVWPLMSDRLGNSMVLMSIAVLLAVGLGVLKGFWDFSQLRRRSAAIGPVITGAVQGIPDFWLILMIQLGASWLYKTYNWTPFKVAWASDEPASSLVYPVFCLALVPGAYVARVTSSAMANVYDREYIRTARAKGLHEFAVIYKHALRNALVQILDGLPSILAVMVSNLLIVEYLFNYPGLTILLKDAVAPIATGFGVRGTTRVLREGQDIPVLVAAGVSLGLIFSLLYLLVAILRRVTDPRLRERDQA